MIAHSIEFSAEFQLVKVLRGAKMHKVENMTNINNWRSFLVLNQATSNIPKSCVLESQLDFPVDVIQQVFSIALSHTIIMVHLNSSLFP